jgi:hypothetical protein
MSTTFALSSVDLHSPVVEAAMNAAADMLGMEVVYIGGLTDDTFRCMRLCGSMPGVSEGVTVARHESLCHHMLAGAPHATSAVREVEEYAAIPGVIRAGITSYVGVAIHRGDEIVGTLCGIDRSAITVPDSVVGVLQGLAGVIEAFVSEAPPAGDIIRRSPSGWRVGNQDGLELTSAMSLADLLAGDVPAPPRPPRVDSTDLDEVERLRLSVRQLEHALAARVVIEQAIGVLSERHRQSPRVAFDRLRKAARTRGRKVHDLARAVVASATEHTVEIPEELMLRQ